MSLWTEHQDDATAVSAHPEYILSCSELPNLPPELRIADFDASLVCLDAERGRWAVTMKIALQEDGNVLVLTGSTLQMRGVRGEDDARRRATKLLAKYMKKLAAFSSFVSAELERG